MGSIPGQNVALLVLVFIDSENWSIRRIRTQYGESGLLGVGSKNKIFQNFLELIWIRRIGPPGYGVSDLLNTPYQTYWVRRIELLRYGVLGVLGYSVLGYSGMVFCTSCVRRIELLGYRVLAESVLLLIFDHNIIYDVYIDVDMVYSSKSGNGLLIRQYSENWSIRRIGTQYGVSGLLGVGSKNKIFQNFLEMIWIRRIKPSGYGISDLLDTAYQTYSVQRIELLRYGVLGSLGTEYWATPERCFLHLGILYDVYTDVDTAYSSKSGNGLLIRQSLEYIV
ncbi:hypothetical protein Tco_0633994 [Tanacetum coccineum]